MRRVRAAEPFAQTGPVDPAADAARTEPARAGLGRRALLTLAAVALLARVVYVVLALRGYAPTTDDAHYNDIATKVADGEGFATQFPYLWTHPTAFRPPLYPLVLGGAYSVFGVHIGVAQALNVLIGTGVVVLVAVVANRLAGRLAALVAAGVAAVHPALLANDGVILTEPLALLLMLAVLLTLDREQYLAAGIFAGLLVLTRPSAQLYVPALIVCVLLLAMRRRASGVSRVTALRPAVRAAVVFGLAAVVVVLPWVVRNVIEFDKPVLVTSNGFNLAAIWSPLALQDGRFVDPIRDQRNSGVTRFAELENLNEADLDATLRKEGLDGLRANVDQVPGKVGGNLLYLFDVRWKANDHPERLDGRHIAFRHRTLPAVWLVLVAGAVGLVLARRQRLGVLILVTVGYMTAVSILTVSPPRLRAPIDVLACVGVGVLVAAIARRRAARGQAPTTGDAPADDALAGAGRP